VHVPRTCIGIEFSMHMGGMLNARTSGDPARTRGQQDGWQKLLGRNQAVDRGAAESCPPHDHWQPHERGGGRVGDDHPRLIFSGLHPAHKEARASPFRSRHISHLTIRKSTTFWSCRELSEFLPPPRARADAVLRLRRHPVVAAGHRVGPLRGDVGPAVLPARWLLHGGLVVRADILALL
jgi:hypothetical protein